MLENLFKLKENHTSVKTEVIAGITTFMTMAYILAVNPSVLSAAGMDPTAVLLATCIASFIGTICMGLTANLPFVLSAGMGLNAYLAYTVVGVMGYHWQVALLAVFVEGIIFIVLSLTNVREAIFDAIPLNLKKGVSVGIGIFIAFIGLQNAKLVIGNKSTLVSITNFTKDFHTAGICSLLAVVGLLITVILYIKKVPGSILIGILAMVAIIWAVPAIPVNPIGALIIVIFGFFFATVSSRMVGLVGSSNNPVSGMAIATLLIATMVIKASGNTGIDGMKAAIAIGSVICIVAAIAGDTSQDLKTGYLLGATPKKQQIGEILGAVVAAFAIGGVMYLLHAAWGFGSEAIPAPQASLMKMVVEGVMGGTLPWTLVLIGVFAAVIVEILGIPVMAFAVGLYLPIYLSTPIFIGGVIRWFLENKKKFADDASRKDFIDRGVLYTSGMIAGEGLVGILLAVFAVVGLNFDFSGIYGGSFETVGAIVGVIAFAALLGSMMYFCKGKKKQNA